MLQVDVDMSEFEVPYRTETEVQPIDEFPPEAEWEQNDQTVVVPNPMGLFRCETREYRLEELERLLSEV